MREMNHLLCLLCGIFAITLNTVDSLMWNHNGIYRQNHKFGEPYVNQWNYNRGQRPWHMNFDYYESGWNRPTGNVKGQNYRFCYDNQHCNRGECCQIIGYSNRGSCVISGSSNYYGCNQYRPKDPTWIQKPIYPGNNKGGGVSMIQTGRPGSCPPDRLQQNTQRYCRQDEDCPYNQKCCFLQGKTVCLYPVFAS